MERPGVFLAGDRFLFAFGMGTGPAVHLPCQESSRCPMNVTSVLLNLHTGTETNGRPNMKTLSRLIDVYAVCVQGWFSGRYCKIDKRGLLVSGIH